MLAIRRNVKKTTEEKKPPPMVFGNSNSIYAQQSMKMKEAQLAKQKAPTQPKPTSIQGQKKLETSASKSLTSIDAVNKSTNLQNSQIAGSQVMDQEAPQPMVYS